MKKILSLVVVLMLMAICLFGCDATPEQFKGEWKFSEVIKVEFIPDELPNGMLDLLKEEYGAEDEADILKKARERYIEEGTFANYYLNFSEEYTYTYDPFMDREATWFFYQISENEGFISFDGNLDVNNGNPAPSVYPNIFYDADTDTICIVENNYTSFLITLKLTRQG